MFTTNLIDVHLEHSVNMGYMHCPLWVVGHARVHLLSGACACVQALRVCAMPGMSLNNLQWNFTSCGNARLVAGKTKQENTELHTCMAYHSLLLLDLKLYISHTAVCA